MIDSATRAETAPAQGTGGIRERLRKSSDDSWERPAPTRDQVRRDLIGTAAVILVAAIALETSRGFGAAGGDD